MKQRRETKMIPEIRNQCYHQLIHHNDLISLLRRRLPGQLNIDVFKYLNRFTTASARVLFDYDLIMTEQETMEQNLL